MALPKPPPSFSPSNRSAPTRQSRKCNSCTGTQRIPMVSSRLPISNPAIPFSTTNTETPRVPRSGLVEA